jgi:hypothetical protein
MFKLFFVSILSFSVIGCTQPIQSNPSPSNSQPGATSSPLETPLESSSPVMQETPSPGPVVEATAAPQDEHYFAEAKPSSVCYGETVNVSARLNNGLKNLFLEQKVNREGKVPPLAGKYILLKSFGETEEDQVVNHSFRIEQKMLDVDGEKMLDVTPGVYLIRLVTSIGEFINAGSVTVKACS